ncbi:hypothetical protein D3C73_1107930 [compost metagenome]
MVADVLSRSIVTLLHVVGNVTTPALYSDEVNLVLESQGHTDRFHRTVHDVSFDVEYGYPVRRDAIWILGTELLLTQSWSRDVCTVDVRVTRNSP